MKPSERIREMRRTMTDQDMPLSWPMTPIEQHIRNDIAAITQYLDEQAESQEPKALEEKTFLFIKDGEIKPKNGMVLYDFDGKRVGYLSLEPNTKPQETLEEKPLCAHAAGICRGNCKPQEEPKKCPPFHHMHTKDGDWSNLSLEEAKKEGITLYPCKKETEPKEDPISTMVEEFAKAESKRIDGQYIILPRPKGKKIDKAFHEFQLFWEDRHADYVDDEKFLEEWSQFIKSQE